MKIYTIGYGGRDTKDFQDALLEKGVRSIADVRLRPDRASMGVYTKTRTSDKGIQKILADVGIGYASIIELGNIFYNSENWQRPYRQLINKTGYLLTDRLYDIEWPSALLCAERDVNRCHRKVIADFLIEQGFEVEHIL
jgi:uncharacterized protein (DUF488 family)